MQLQAYTSTFYMTFSCWLPLTITLQVRDVTWGKTSEATQDTSAHTHTYCLTSVETSKHPSSSHADNWWMCVQLCRSNKVWQVNAWVFVTVGLNVKLNIKHLGYLLSSLGYELTVHFIWYARSTATANVYDTAATKWGANAMLVPEVRWGWPDLFVMIERHQ